MTTSEENKILSKVLSIIPESLHDQLFLELEEELEKRQKAKSILPASKADIDKILDRMR